MAIVKEIRVKDWVDFKLQTNKVHILTRYDFSAGDVIEDGAWHNFGDAAHPWVESTYTSYGRQFTIAPDKSSIIIKRPCLYLFSINFHVAEGGVAVKSPDVHVRLLKNGKTESRASQGHWARSATTARTGTIAISGKEVTTAPNEYINIQYNIAANSEMDFYTTPEFDNPVAISLGLDVIGLPEYNERNEKIKWKIID